MAPALKKLLRIAASNDVAVPFARGEQQSRLVHEDL
jgi:hypothetical protein